MFFIVIDYIIELNFKDFYFLIFNFNDFGDLSFFLDKLYNDLIFVNFELKVYYFIDCWKFIEKCIFDGFKEREEKNNLSGVIIFISFKDKIKLVDEESILNIIYIYFKEIYKEFNIILYEILNKIFFFKIDFEIGFFLYKLDIIFE